MIPKRIRSVLSWAPVFVAVCDFGSIRKVSGYSMQPTLNGDLGNGADFVALEKLSGRFGWRDPERGDVFTLRHPRDPKKIIVKRLIAIQGDIVQGVDSAEAHRIPEGHGWFEGDNLRKSSDSNSFGPVSLGLVEGRVLAIVWPWHRATGLGNEENPAYEDRIIYRCRKNSKASKG
ncbi:hypothetical protein NDN08_005541 [Rhodosorus marinus]|uniref:Mitochondrial inner membrane protease subunit 2 n=1 Tax=Rhodosorus marinus TaxID=101924 RepID=A0AAV8V4D1_9RHOD|nr:hypothetical protein NDN08_005541 [Rhodosorus marinus]